MKMINSFIKKYWPELVVVAGPVILLMPSIISGQVLYWGTPSLQFVPWQYTAGLSLQRGEIPLWNSLNGMGSPLAANYQIGIFYPLNWLLYLFQAALGAPGIAVGYSCLTIFHLAWAGVGMVRLLRQLEIGGLGQVVGGIAFSLSGFLIGRLGFFSMIWTAAWLPWVIYYGGRISLPIRSDKTSPGFSIGLVICLSMQLLAGHAQLAWYSIVMTAIWVGFGGFIQSKWRGLLRSEFYFGIASILAVMIASVQLIPTAELLFLSQRSDAVNFDTSTTYSFWPWRVLTIVMPNFFGNPGSGNYWGYASYWEDALYIGVIPIGLAVFALFVNLRKKQAEESEASKYHQLSILAMILIPILLIIAMGKFTPVFKYLYTYVPGFEMFNSPTRWTFLIQFLLAILAAIGTHQWGSISAKGKRKWRLGIVVVVALGLSGFGGRLFFQNIDLTFVDSILILAIWALAGIGFVILRPPITCLRAYRVWGACLILILFLDILFVARTMVPTASMDFYLTKKAIGEASASRFFMPAEDEYLIKFSRFLRFRDFRTLEPIGTIRKTLLPNLNLLDQISSANNFDPILPDRYARWISHLSTLSDYELENWLKLMNVGSLVTRNIHVKEGVEFQPLNAHGRYQWYRRIWIERDDESAWTAVKVMLSNLESNQRPEVVVLEQEPGFEIIPKMEEAAFHEPVISEISSSAERIIIEVTSVENGILMVADCWYPGWKLFVDGAEVELLRADYLFMAAAVPAGRHIVEFVYQPESYKIGIILSVLGCLILLASFIIHHRLNIPIGRKEKQDART